MKKTVINPEYSENMNRQKMSAEKIAGLNNNKYNETGIRSTFGIVTFGCQMNAHDSEKIETLFTDMGYEKNPDELSADIIIYNTCCVRENAENRLYGNLGILKHMKEQGSEFKTILCGCMMQRPESIEKIRKSYDKVADVIIGTFNIHRLPELLLANIETGGLIIDIWDRHADAEIGDDLPSIREKSFKASINIMYGCDNFCSYCIVPYVRGRERSRKPVDILNETARLASDGVMEIMLLGQNVNSYDGGISFAGLLREVSAISGIERIRFMTSHPKDLSDELIEEIKNNKKICRHIHLPLQSGNNDILMKMNRRYTREQYIALAEKLRRDIPGIAITTDIIVGFPSETDATLDDTIDVARNVRFSGAYTFLYSKRAGTPAADMNGQVDENAAKKLFNRLLDAVNPIIHEENAKQINSDAKVLVENISNGIATGRADNNTLIHFPADADTILGNIVDVKITDCKTFYCLGEVLKKTFKA